MKSSAKSWVQFFLALTTVSMFLGDIASAASIQVLAPTKFKSSLGGTSATKTFTASENNLVGVMTITNGNGQDYSLKNRSLPVQVAPK